MKSNHRDVRKTLTYDIQMEELQSASEGDCTKVLKISWKDYVETFEPLIKIGTPDLYLKTELKIESLVSDENPSNVRSY
ncbi:unnamed protein product [Ambrosiozyma monospora]|uniref:Unnamed protein product n=1 Tax=Ambrosiozyma monospora TaxID=43982 RepID=A0ACB5T5M4_AMBMO|nr:unnamed protein product [Ambrosiozyma monospora]